MSEVIATDPDIAMHSFIQRIATGPELSKSLSEAEAAHGMQLILDGQASAVQAAIFLIALRMKRETDEENRGILQALLAATEQVKVPVAELLDIADPYNGYTRGLPATAFLPAVLAACGLPAVCHGVETVAPKFGVTPYKVYQAAALNCDLSPTAAAAQLAQKDIGWAYIDQRHFCPKLHQLVGLRTQIVKRTCLTTIEVLLGPLRAQHKTHLMTGFVHKAYPPIYTMLARSSGFDSALLVRGVEGGVIPSLAQVSRSFYYHSESERKSDSDDGKIRFDPQELTIGQTQRAVPYPDVDVETAAAATAEAGLAALNGTAGLMYDSLVCGAALALWHVGRYATLSQAGDAVRQVLNSGAALAHFTQTC